jgi:hypothetical protein
MINNKLDTNDALRSLCPGAQWQLIGSTVEWKEQLDSDNLTTGKIIPTNLNWFSPEIPVPTQEQIDARLRDLQAIQNSLKYQSQRKQEYPPLADLADALFWQANGDASKMTAYLAQVAAVKDKYPKGTA